MVRARVDRLHSKSTIQFYEFTKPVTKNYEQHGEMPSTKLSFGCTRADKRFASWFTLMIVKLR